MVSPKREFTIGKLSNRTDVNIETIRYYERAGIMPHPPRSQNGYRLYNENHQKRLSFIRRSRELGFPLEEIRGLLALVDDNSYTCAQVQSLTIKHLENTRRKISDLQKLENIFKEMVSQCGGELTPSCPVIDILFGEN